MIRIDLRAKVIGEIEGIEVFDAVKPRLDKRIIARFRPVGRGDRKRDHEASNEFCFGDREKQRRMNVSAVGAKFLNTHSLLSLERNYDLYHQAIPLASATSAGTIGRLSSVKGTIYN